MTFLQEVAQDIKQLTWGQSPEENRRTVVVFPNKRSMWYFRKYYAQLIERHQFITTMPWDSFLSSAVDCVQPAPIKSLVLLYKAVKQVLGSEPAFKEMSFEQFFPIGQIILSDFDEIDNYLIEPQKIFLNLAQLEELSSLDFLTKEQLEVIRKFWRSYSTIDQNKFFTTLFSRLGQVYDIFTRELLERQLCYDGLRNRLIVERLESGQELFSEYQTIALVGFYALSASERKIFSWLKANRNARFYWDYDEFYLKEPHEAGYFLRLNMQKYPDSLKIERNKIATEAKEVHVFAVPGLITQARILPKVFEQLGLAQQSELLNRTAIILLDESLLYPVIYSLPQYVEKFNVALQFPFRLTNLFSFFDQWFYLISRLHRGDRVYAKDLESLISNQVFKKNFEQVYQRLSEYLSGLRVLYITLPQEFVQTTPFKVIKAQTIEQLIEDLQQLVYVLYRNSQDLEREYVYTVYTEINRLSAVLSEIKDVDISFDILFGILRQIFAMARVPFESDFTEGLQIMRIMESRNLDFDYVIMLGMNEGVFPETYYPHTFFTQSIRAFYGLPLLKYQDSLNSYLFYRLLQRAKKLALIYDSSLGSGKSSGKSRFILQLESETDLIKGEYEFLQDLSLESLDIKLDAKALNIQPQQRLSILSASAIISFLTCPRRFFYSRVLNLQVPQPQKYQLAVNEFGEIVHKILEIFYKRIIHQNRSSQITAKQIEKQLDQLKQITLEAFEQVLGQRVNPNEGLIILLVEAAQRFARRVLEYDMSQAPFEIISIERDKLRGKGAYYWDLRLSSGEKVKLQGVFDRIHLRDQVYYLVDYKTSQKEHKFVWEQLTDQPLKSNYEAIFQMLFYSLIYKRLHPDAKVVPWLIDIPRLISSKDFDPRLEFSSKEKQLVFKFSWDNPEQWSQVLDDFEQYLIQVVEQIFSPEQRFDKVEDLSNCESCPYRHLCDR